MTRTVWKYELPGSETTLDLPVDAKPIHVATQGAGTICMWVEVDPSAPTRRRRFYVVGTGHPIPPDVFPPIHVGSFLTDQAGTFVFHVYESLDARLDGAASKDGAE